MITDPLPAGIDTRWMERAACTSTDPEAFFQDGHGAYPREAFAVCSSCPVQAACAQYARDIGATHGIWGGVTARSLHRAGQG